MKQFELKRTYTMTDKECRFIMKACTDGSKNESNDVEFADSICWFIVLHDDFDSDTIGLCDNGEEFYDWAINTVYDYAQEHGNQEEKLALERVKRVWFASKLNKKEREFYEEIESRQEKLLAEFME